MTDLDIGREKIVTGQKFAKHEQMVRELKLTAQSVERGDYDLADQILQRSNLIAYPQYEREQKGVLYWILGLLHDQHQEWSDAERYLSQSISMLQSGVDQEALIRSMIALSKVVSKQGDIEQSLQVLKRAYKIAIYEPIATSMEIHLLFQLGITHGKLGELYSSIHYLTEALQLNHLIKAQFNIGEIYMSLGICYMQLERFEESKDAFNNAIHAFQLDDNKENLAGTYMNFGVLYSYHQVYDESYRCLKKAV